LPIIRELARRAVVDPAAFRHEVLDCPRLDLEVDEWRELADLAKGKVPDDVHSLILARGGERPIRPPPDRLFTPGVLIPLLDDAGAPDRESAPPLDPLAIPRLSTREIVIATKSGKLRLDLLVLQTLAMDRARSSNEDWSGAVLDFPGTLKEAVLEKAARTESSDECANLLAWLETEGVSRTTLFSLGLGKVRDGHISFSMVAWLSQKLTTRAAWDKHGVATVSTLMAQRAFAELCELYTVAWSEACRGNDEPPRGLLEAIQVSFAEALINLVRASIDQRDEPRALAALSALACLDPPSRVSRSVHELANIPGLSSELIELIGVNERLVRHSNARDASLESLIAAVHALRDAFG